MRLAPIREELLRPKVDTPHSMRAAPCRVTAARGVRTPRSRVRRGERLVQGPTQPEDPTIRAAAMSGAGAAVAGPRVSRRSYSCWWWLLSGWRRSFPRRMRGLLTAAIRCLARLA